MVHERTRLIEQSCSEGVRREEYAIHGQCGAGKAVRRGKRYAVSGDAAGERRRGLRRGGVGKLDLEAPGWIGIVTTHDDRMTCMTC